MAAKIATDPVVDRGQAAPLYHQIFLQLREEITSGERAHGARMPTEKELAAQFSVSRVTARRALHELAGNRLVDRKRRVGTTVAYETPSGPVQGRFDQGAESLIDFGPHSRAKLIEFGMRAVATPVDELLRIDRLTNVLRIVRIHQLNGQPVGHFVIYFSPSLSTCVTRADVETASMYYLLDQIGVRIGSAKQTISATIADASLSQALNVDIGSPLLRVSRTLFDDGGTPVQHVLAKFRPDQYQISMDLDVHASGIPTPPVA